MSQKDRKFTGKWLEHEATKKCSEQEAVFSACQNSEPKVTRSLKLKIDQLLILPLSATTE